jgi:hypothetical protein
MNAEDVWQLVEHSEGSWWLGADEVIVAFTDEFAASIGYPDNA